MNLALKDLAHNRFRFLSSTTGIALLLMVVLAIGGIIRGVILDSTSIIEMTGADLWVVEKETLGPFVEVSRMPEHYHDEIERMPGVAEASPMVTAWDNVFRIPRPTPLMKFMYMNALVGTKTMVQPGWMAVRKEQRFVVIGYERGRLGGPPPSAIVKGRGIEADSYELVADVKTGFDVGEHVRIGNDDFTVVGLTTNVVAFNADPVVYMTLDDAQEALILPANDQLRDQRELLWQRYFADLGARTPQLIPELKRRVHGIADNARVANAILVKLEPGANAQEVASQIERWKSLHVMTSAEEANAQLMGSNRLILFQLSLFRVILVLIAGVIIGLIIYTFTLDKIGEIAVMKLIGSPGRYIYSMIFQQAVLMGSLGVILGSVLELLIEDYFPRRVEVTIGDIGQMLVIMVLVALAASILAVRRSMLVDPRSVLA